MSSSLSLTQRWTAGMGGSISQGLVRFLYSVLIGRLLGAAMLGTVNAAISTALLLSLLWPTSAGQAATRYVAQLRGADRPDQAQAVAGYLGRRMLAGALPLALASVGICLGPLGTDLPTALSTGLLLLGYSGWSFTRGVQYGAGQIARAAGWDAAGSAFSLLMLVAVLLLDWQAVLLVPLALGYGAYALVCWPRKNTAAIDPSLRSQMNQFIAYGILGTVSSTGLLQLSMIGAQLAGTPLEAGYYAAALSLATPATMLARTLSQVLFPVMAEAGGRGDQSSLRGQSDAMTRALVLTMVPIFGALALASEAVLHLSFGEQYLPAQSLLPVLLLAVLFTTIPIATINRLNSVGVSGARFVSIVAAGGLLLAMTAWLLLTPQLGVAGIAIGYLIAMFAVAAVLIGRGWRLDRQRWLGLWGRTAVALGLQIAALWYLAAFDAPAWLGILFAAGFMLLWSALSWPDIRRLRERRAVATPGA